MTQSFVQGPLPKVDLLLVIDDTASMAQEQAALADHFAALLADLDALDIAWQLGVVTTEMGGPEAGWLRGSPYVLTPATPDRDAAFASMVQVGTAGPGPEAGLAAAATAIDLAGPGGPNAGFRRPDALLHVVFVSDTDDQSADWLGGDPAATFLGLLTDEGRRTGLPARASALVGPLPSGCTSATGSAQPAVAYDQVVEGSGGVVVSICSADFVPVVQSLSEASVVWSTRFALANPPVDGSVEVRVDGDRVDGWSLDPDGPAILFDAAPSPEARIEVTYLVLLTP